MRSELPEAAPTKVAKLLVKPGPEKWYWLSAFVDAESVIHTFEQGGVFPATTTRRTGCTVAVSCRPLEVRYTVRARPTTAA